MTQCVIINLCIDTKLTRLLGVENHVCELQLVTAGFAAVAVCALRARTHRGR